MQKFNKLDLWFHQFHRWYHNKVKQKQFKKKLAKLISLQPKERPPKSRPQHIRSVLLVETSGCVGDSLFTNALIDRLALHSLDIDLITLQSTQYLFLNNPHIKNIYSLETCSISPKAWDIVVDLSYAANNEILNKIDFFNSIHKTQFTLTCSPLLAKSNFCSDYLNLQNIVFFGDRLSQVEHYLCGESLRIIPCYHSSIDECNKALSIRETLLNNKKFIYVNAKARNENRSLSTEQIEALALWFNNQNHFVGLFYSDLELNYKNIISMPKTSFGILAKLLQNSSGVISPDTSIIHLASAYDLPTVVLYEGNCLEAYNFPMEDVWQCTSRKCIALKPNERFKLSKQSVKNIPVEKIISAVSDLFS